MVIIVPALAEGDEREKEMVVAAVRCVIASITDSVRQRGDRERHVVQHHRGNDEPPYQHLPSIRAKVWPDIGQCFAEQKDTHPK